MPDAMPVYTPALAPSNLADPADYRKALSCFTTGVTVVTTYWQNADWGMTSNSFTSVSLDPRLVLWCIRKAAKSVEAFTSASGFCVSILAKDQQALATKFAGGEMAARFADVPVQRQSSQRLRVNGAVAWLDCSLHQVVDAGDHHIVIGQVNDFGWRDDKGLAYWKSQFSQVTPLPK